MLLFGVFCCCGSHRCIPISTTKSSSTGATRRTSMLPPMRHWVTSTRSLHLRLRTPSLPRSLLDYPRPQLRCDAIVIGRFRCTRLIHNRAQVWNHPMAARHLIRVTTNLLHPPQNLLSSSCMQCCTFGYKYTVQGSPSGCGWHEIPEVTQVEKEHAVIVTAYILEETWSMGSCIAQRNTPE